MTPDDFTRMLFACRDEKYADFTAKLIPTLPRERFIGVRAPEYKRIVRAVKGDAAVNEYLCSLPHTYHEENCLHAALLNGIKDYDECLERVSAFIPYIDNWAVNDGLNPKAFARNHGRLIESVLEWIKSEAPYTRRFGLRILMAHFLEEDFDPEYLELAASLRSGEYYVNMMTAWLFAEALVKQWDAAVSVIEGRKLDPWTHNKAIQKARESFRVPDDRKQYLYSLRVKQMNF